MILREVKDVLLRKSSLTFDADTNIFMLEGMDLTLHSNNRIVSVQVAEKYEDEELTKISRCACLFRLQCSIRATEAGQDPETSKVLFEIEAQHDVVFDSDSVVTIEEIEKFSADDIISNAAWPYWKEHVTSLCSKAGLSPLQVPSAQKNDPIKITAKREL